MKLLALLLLVGVPCFGQTTPTIELGKTSIYVGMPQDKAMAALATDGFLLLRDTTDNAEPIRFAVALPNTEGKTRIQGTIAFTRGVVVEATVISSPKETSDVALARGLFALAQKFGAEGHTACTLGAQSKTLNDQTDWKMITLQCGDKRISIDITENRGADTGSDVELAESVVKR